MASLGNATINVDVYRDPLTGEVSTTDYLVTGSVTVYLGPGEQPLPGNPYLLKSQGWGEDTFSDDLLFSYDTQAVYNSGTYNFSKVVPRQTLDEDNVSLFDNSDEVYNKFTLQRFGSTFFPFRILATTKSFNAEGYYGLNPGFWTSILSLTIA